MTAPLNKNLFSNAYKLEVSAADLECVDIDFTDDVELYVDPLLLYRSPIRLFNEAHTLIVQFFEHAIALVKSDKADNAKEMFRFPDAENHLGIAHDGPGHGPSRDLGKKMFDELVCNKDIQEHGLAFLNEFQFLVEDIAFDLVSDAAVQIAKDIFILYTQELCQKYKIPVEKVIVRQVFNFEDYEWDSKSVYLPVNPATKKYFLLTPKTVVRRYPSGSYQQFYDEIYKEFLYEKERVRLLQGVGKKPRITYQEIKDKYCNKKSVVAFVKEHPDERLQFLGKIKPTPETAWLEAIATSHQANINKIITAGDVASVIASTSDKKIKNVAKSAIEVVKHQQTLKVPRRKLKDSIEQFTVECKRRFVLLLGNYTHPIGSARLREIKSILESDYDVLECRDLADERSESLIAKVVRLSALARFTVIENSYAGGQLTELEALRSIGFVMPILKNADTQATSMTIGIDRLSASVKEFPYLLIPSNGIDGKYVKEAVEWAENQLKGNGEYWDKNYGWRNK